MARRIPILKWLVYFTVVYSCTLTVLLIYSNPTMSPCSQEAKDDNMALQKKNNPEFSHMDSKDWGPHKMTVIVPFRDRLEELLEFAPHLHEYLNRKHVRHEILVVNQVDSLR